MATIRELKEKADERFEDLLSEVITRQRMYFRKHSKFFQLRKSGRVVDGTETMYQLRKAVGEQDDFDVPYERTVPFEFWVNEWRGDTVGWEFGVMIETPKGRRFKRTYRFNMQDKEDVDSGWEEQLPI